MKWVSDETLSYDTTLSGHKTLSRDNKLSCHKRSEICQRNFKRFWNTPQFRGFLDFLPTFFCIYTYVFKIAQQIRLTLKISFPTYICINDTSSSGEWHFTEHLPGFNNGVYKSEEGQKTRLHESSCEMWIYFVKNLENVRAADFNFFGKCICQHYDPLALVLISQRKSTSEKGLEQENIAIYISYKLARFPWSPLLFISLWSFIRMDNIFSETRLYIFFFRSWYISISGVDIFFYFRSWYISDFRSWYMFYFKSWYIFISGVPERLYCNLYLLLKIAKVKSDNKSIFRIKLENFV